jgi:hypothetical protein
MGMFRPSRVAYMYDSLTCPQNSSNPLVKTLMFNLISYSLGMVYACSDV